jgi:hypothetical protein
MVGEDSPRLEAMLEVNGVSVALDEAFADTFAMRGAFDPVVVIGDAGAPHSRIAEEPRLDSLRAEQSALASEIQVLERELASLWAAGPEPAVAAPGWAPLVALLDEALTVRDPSIDVSDLAERLDRLAQAPGTSTRDRTDALEQLLGECKEAIAAVRAPVVVSPPVDPTRAAAVEEVREAMLTLAAEARPGRRQRQRMERLRETESRLLAELGHPTYLSLLGAIAAGPTSVDVESRRSARESVLVELESFLAERLSDSLGANRDRLMSEAATALGELPANLEGRDPRLLAARLRATPRGDLSRAVRLAAALEREMALDTTVARTPEEVLHLARARIAEPSSTWVPAGEPGRERMESRRSELADRLAEVSDVLASRERAATVDLRDVASEGLDLAGLVHSARSVSVVGAMPLLLIESARGASGGAAPVLPDPLTVAAVSAVAQLLWVTDRVEVAEAVSALGEVAEVIEV